MDSKIEKRCPDCGTPEYYIQRDGPCCEAEYYRALGGEPEVKATEEQRD